MFENIGGKIKALAKVICWIGIVASIIAAISVWAAGDRWNPTFLPGLLILVAGCLGSWLGSFFTYGLGELIESTQQNAYTNAQILEHLRKNGESGKSNSKSDPSPAPTPSYFSRPHTTSSSTNSGWRCKQCDTLNAATSLYCKDCGTSR